MQMHTFIYSIIVHALTELNSPVNLTGGLWEKYLILLGQGKNAGSVQNIPNYQMFPDIDGKCAAVLFKLWTIDFTDEQQRVGPKTR